MVNTNTGCNSAGTMDPKHLENVLEITREYVGYVMSGRILEDGSSAVSRWDEFKSNVESYAEEFEEAFDDEEEDYLTAIFEFAEKKFKEEGWLLENAKDIRQALIVICTNETDFGIEKYAAICEDKNNYLDDVAAIRESLDVEDDAMFSWDTTLVTVDVSKLLPADKAC